MLLSGYLELFQALVIVDLSEETHTGNRLCRNRYSALAGAAYAASADDDDVAVIVVHLLLFRFQIGQAGQR